MKKLLRKLDIKSQYAIIITILSVISLTLYSVYLTAIKGTTFFKSYPILSTIIYWILAIIISVVITTVIIDKATDDLKKTVGYLKEFSEIKFNLVADESNNDDIYRLDKELANLQKEMFRTYAELEQKNLEITRLNEEQSEDFKYKKNLISSISHDLKTPLTIIHATVCGIRDGIFSEEECKKELDNVILEVENTTSMIHDAISIFKMDGDFFKLKKEDLHLIDLITSTTDNFKKLFSKYHHKLFLNLPIDLTINADKEQFSRVLQNLILNAITYSPKGSNITINLLNSTNNAILEVINEGVTIPQEEIDKIFEPFYRLDKSRTKKDDHGNGLGLFIANEICKKHNFDLDCINLDNAVKFYIVFPNEK